MWTRTFIDGIVLSDKPFCKKSEVPVSSFEITGTSEGLDIGDTYEKVVQLYGEPNYVKIGKELSMLIRIELPSSVSNIDCDKALAYGENKADSLFTTWIFLSKNRVSTILMTISE